MFEGFSWLSFKLDYWSIHKEKLTTSPGELAYLKSARVSAGCGCLASIGSWRLRWLQNKFILSCIR